MADKAKGKWTGPAVWLISLLFFWPACAPERKAESRKGSGEYAASIKSPTTGLRALEGGTAGVALLLRNEGSRIWSSQDRTPCFLSYHLLDEAGETLRHDHARTAFPQPVRPGEEVSLTLRVKAPLKRGSYQLEFDLLREGLAWFKDGGSPTLIMPFLVEERVSSGETTVESSSPEFGELLKLIRITLETDAVEFQGKTGLIRGFSAGDGYPQVWLRDAATTIPASRFFYPVEYLESWIMEHLAFQKPDGGLEDWIDARGRSDKNTVETDQESSAVQAAYQVFLLKGKGWLGHIIGDEAVVDRLERAVAFLFQTRFNPERGLITGAHTADWGDVDPEDSDQKAIYVDEKTHWTADIYDQSMVYEACRELAAMLAALGLEEKADGWTRKAASLREAADRHLWQEDRGFYRVHIHLDPFPHEFDEDGMFAMGGNAQAILSGLADGRKADRIIRTAIERQTEFGVSTISGSLLPPYPAGFFKHPAVDEPYEYQNGGQWDWFGGRLLAAMFENGWSAQAKDKLIEIIRKNLRNGGFFEWDTREGAGRGSDNYAGSAGSLARALFEGYFGFRLSEKGLTLEPKLGEDSGRVEIRIPTSGLILSYDYRPVADEKKIVLSIESNHQNPSEVKVLVPWKLFGLSRTETDRTKIRVLDNGKPVTIRWESRGHDDFIVIDTEFKKHTIEIGSYFLPME